MDTRLCIGMPTGGTMKVETVSCLVDSFAHLPFEKYLSIQKGGYSHYSRNIVVDNALKHKATHVMFIDADMIFPPDGVLKLLNHDKDIIGGNYNERRLPLQSTLKFADEKGNLIPKRVEDLPKQLAPCFSVGSGFLLIKIGVFEKLEKPYFFVEDEGEFVTEDYYFCKKAHKAGIEVFCDPTIVLKHCGDYYY